jgi:glycosyltransferase 2 family protein
MALRYAASAVLTVLFLWLAFRGTDFQKLVLSMQEANYWWILVSFLVLMASHVVRAWRWRYLLEPIKPDIGLRNLFSGVMIGYLVNNILPRAGEVARPYAIGRLESISKTAAFGTIVVERLMDTLSFLVLVMLIPFVYDGPLRESFPWLLEGGVILSVATGAVMLMLILLMARRDWTDRLLGLTDRLLSQRMARRIKRLVHSFLDGLLFLKHPRRFLFIGVSSVVVWGLYVLMTYTAFYAFHLEGRLGFGGAIVVQAISSIGVAIPTPGSTGSYHMFAAQTLTRLFSVDGAIALSFATVTHAAGYVGVTVIGLYFFIRDQITVAAAVTKADDGVS